jgi:hypothetical protein
MSGVLSAVLSAGCTIKVYSGNTGTIVLNTLAPGISLLSNAGWRLKATIVCKTIGATGTLQANSAITVGSTVTSDRQVITNFDTTVSNTFQIRATWGGLSLGNTITTDMCYADYKFA